MSGQCSKLIKQLPRRRHVRFAGLVSFLDLGVIVKSLAVKLNGAKLDIDGLLVPAPRLRCRYSSEYLCDLLFRIDTVNTQVVAV